MKLNKKLMFVITAFSLISCGGEVAPSVSESTSSLESISEVISSKEENSSESISLEVSSEEEISEDVISSEESIFSEEVNSSEEIISSEETINIARRLANNTFLFFISLFLLFCRNNTILLI